MPVTEQCPNCVYYTGNGTQATCLAFPNGIPAEILSGEHDHRKVFKGDHNVRFEPRKYKKVALPKKKGTKKK